jgi:signal transduction histidine kinase
VLTGLLLVCPVRGFFGIIVLPLISQAIIDLGWRGATAVGVYLFALSIGLFGIFYGASAMFSALLGYSTAFAFTIVFTILTRQAIEGRNRSEKFAAELREANRQLREHAAQAGELATTRERNRLAREIHDGLGHYLTVVKTQLDAASALLPGQPEKARESVEKAAHLAATALDDVRRSVGTLRTDLTRPPLPDSVRLLARESGLPVSVRLEGAIRELPPGLEHALFRSAQEGLTNVRKHAAATAVEVAIDFRTPGRVTLSVADNGPGLDGGAHSAGFGLIGLRERIEVLGGRVEAGHQAAGGFTLRIEVPA